MPEGYLFDTTFCLGNGVGAKTSPHGSRYGLWGFGHETCPAYWISLGLSAAPEPLFSNNPPPPQQTPLCFAFSRDYCDSSAIMTWYSSTIRNSKRLPADLTSKHFIFQFSPLSKQAWAISVPPDFSIPDPVMSLW